MIENSNNDAATVDPTSGGAGGGGAGGADGGGGAGGVQSRSNVAAGGVASSQQKAVVMLGLIGAVALFLVYSIFSGGGEEEAPEEEAITISTQQSIELPEILEEEPPPLEIDLDEKEIDIELLLQKIRSPMVVITASLFDGIGGAGGKDDKRDSDSEVSVSGIIGDTSRIIAQGKIIDGVLETAINTDLPGTLRAVVTRDIYGESGTDALIPKGSRIIGIYNNSISRGQSRILIIWNRIIRPDGVDVKLSSPGVDNLGRSGATGEVNDKYWEVFQAAILTSAITLTAAAAVEKITDNTTTSVIKDGEASTIYTNGPAAQAGIELSKTLSSAGKGLIGTLLNIKPTITVNQGIELKIMVNQDISFPRGVISSAKMVF